MLESLLTAAQAVVCVQSVMLACVLAAQGAPRSLVIFCVLLALHVSSEWLLQHLLPRFAGYNGLFVLAYGPLVFLTLSTLCRQPVRTWLHSVPVALAALMASSGLLSPAALAPWMSLSILTYCGMSWCRVRKLDDCRRNGMRLSVMVFSGLIGYQVFYVLALRLTTADVAAAIYLVFLCLLAWLLWRATFGCWQRGQGIWLPPVSAPAAEAGERSSAYRETIRQLQDYFSAAKPYVDGQLTVSDVALALKLPARQLSEAINAECGCSFSEWVNRQRVDEARRLLARGTSGNLLDVALDAGFTSKSSFNLMFKRYAGCTPSDYRRHLAGTLNPGSAPGEPLRDTQ